MKAKRLERKDFHLVLRLFRHWENASVPGRWAGWQVCTGGEDRTLCHKTILPGPGEGANIPTQGWRIKIYFTPLIMN